MPPPTAIVCIGMAGSGKTTFMQRINSHLHTKREPPYVLNLDPAVRSVPFDANIDIRDSIDYKEVMAQYNLGPNGGILTSLNLFATKVDQILDILERRTGLKPEPKDPAAPSNAPEPQPEIKNIIIDTPGQIEVFVWSASGQILLSSLASSFPTVLAYVIDTPRTASTSTFMSNMLYACSILYKTKLPMILVFNKTDAQDWHFAKEWMTDFEAFQRALRREEETGVFGGSEGGPAVGGSGYMSSLLNSMSLVFEEFYKHLSVVGVSSVTGEGIDGFFEAVKWKSEEFERDYRPELERRRKAKEEERKGRREQDLGGLMRDLDVGGGGAAKGQRKGKEEPETISDLEDEGDDEPEAELIEPDTMDEEDRDEEDGLEKRYEQAMAAEGQDGAGPSGDDFSFARYIHTAKMNG